jgi:DNA (cytosine-5)-methyltransferase 1
MINPPKLLDLFCGAGGAAVGYARAGFEVVGVDIKPQKHYPFEFHQGDALAYVAAHGWEFDAIHASPPCQGYSKTMNFLWKQGKEHPMLIEQTRFWLEMLGLPYIIENVKGAPLRTQITLCGLMFGLRLLRDRIFESSILLMQPYHPPHHTVRIGINGYVQMSGSGDCHLSNGHHVPKDHRTRAAWVNASGIDWMDKKELTQAIPPAYTEYLGRQLMRHILQRREEAA